MKRLILVVLLGFILSGCGVSGPVVEDINKTFVGSLSKGTGEVYLLKTDDQGVVELHDGAVTLGTFVGQAVRVTGQYSGTTLYVDVVNRK